MQSWTTYKDCHLYRIAGNFRGCKFLRICLQTLQKKFSWFLFSWGNACSSFFCSDHTPILTRTYTTSPYATYVAWLKFSWFLFSLLPAGQRKTRKFAPHENFPLYGTPFSSAPQWLYITFFLLWMKYGASNFA